MSRLLRLPAKGLGPWPLLLKGVVWNHSFRLYFSITLSFYLCTSYICIPFSFRNAYVFPSSGVLDFAGLLFPWHAGPHAYLCLPAWPRCRNETRTIAETYKGRPERASFSTHQALIQPRRSPVFPLDPTSISSQSITTQPSEAEQIFSRRCFANQIAEAITGSCGREIKETLIDNDEFPPQVLRWAV